MINFDPRRKKKRKIRWKIIRKRKKNVLYEKIRYARRIDT